MKKHNFLQHFGDENNQETSGTPGDVNQPEEGNGTPTPTDDNKTDETPQETPKETPKETPPVDSLVNRTMERIKAEQARARDLEAVKGKYNLTDDQIEKKVLPYANDKNITLSEAMVLLTHGKDDSAVRNYFGENVVSNNMPQSNTNTDQIEQYYKDVSAGIDQYLGRTGIRRGR